MCGEIAEQRLARQLFTRTGLLRSIVLPILLQLTARHNHLVYFVRSIIDPRRPLVPVPVRQQRRVGQSERAVHLNRTIQNLLQNAGNEKFDQRDIFSRSRRALVIDRPRGLQDQQARRVDFRTTLRNPLLHVLPASQHHSGRYLPARGVTAHQLKRPLADTDPTHAVMNSSWSKPLLRDLKTLAFLAEQVALRHATVFVPDFGVTGIIASLVAHHADVSYKVKSRRRYRHDDLARALVTVRSAGIGDRHHDGEARSFRG